MDAARLLLAPGLLTPGLLTLGPVALQGFELPARIAIGGEHRLAIHRLTDGSRVVDTLGPDEDDIAWSGALTGPFAAARARALDDLRRAGQPIGLSFGDWSAAVIVRRFTAEANLGGWIPYRIACAVASNLPETDPLPAELPFLSAPGDPGPAPGLDAADLATIVGAASSLAQAAAVRSTR